MKKLLNSKPLRLHFAILLFQHLAFSLMAVEKKEANNERRQETRKKLQSIQQQLEGGKHPASS